jgi:hypothetical protein
MKALSVFVAVLFLCLPLITACSTLRSGTAVKAAADSKNDWLAIASEGMEPRDGWAARHIPGWKAVSDFIPKPTEARKEWDQWKNRKRYPWADEFSGD